MAYYRLADTDVARWFRRLVDGWLVERGGPAGAGDRAVRGALGAPGAGRRGRAADVTEIVRVDQVDAVYRPAAGGEFVQVLNASVEGGAALPPKVEG